MGALRIDRDDQQSMAIEDLLSAATSCHGLHIAKMNADVISVEYDGARWTAAVTARDTVSKGDAEVLVATASQFDQVIVANQIAGAAKAYLTATGPKWSWFDRRSGLQLRHYLRGSHGEPDQVLHIVSSIEGGTAGHGRSLGHQPTLASPPSSGPIRGRAGIALAAELVRYPHRPVSLRNLAGRLSMSHTAFNTAARDLRDGDLVDADGTPRFPALFDELAKLWLPQRWSPLQQLPTAENAERLGANLLDGTKRGWALGGDLAAMAWGAPMAAAAKPLFWVPGHNDARRAERALGEGSWEDHAAVVAVAPTPLVCDRRLLPPDREDLTLTTHPAFLALELANDPGRGAEILADWDLEELRHVR